MKFRLSTAIVMMLVAAVRVWLNVRERHQYWGYIQLIDFDGPSIAHGFPVTACYEVYFAPTEALPVSTQPDFSFQPHSSYVWNALNLAVNIGVLITTVSGIGFMLERFVFRAAKSSNRVEARE